MLDKRMLRVCFAGAAILIGMGMSGILSTGYFPAAMAVAAADPGSTSLAGTDPRAEAGSETDLGGNSIAHGGGGHAQDLGHGNASQKLEDASEFKADLAIYTFVVFFLLLAILSKFAWPAIAEALERREQHIAAHIAAAETKLHEAQDLYAQHEAELAGTADEVRALLEEARRDAERTRHQIIKEAKASAQTEHDRVMRDIDHAVDMAKRELAEQSANLVIQLAGQVVQEKLTPEHQNRIAREALSRFTHSEPSPN